LNPVDGHVRVWRPRNTTFQQEHIVGTTAFGGGGFTVWGCSPINALSDSYPVTRLTKVVALLPLVADSLAQYGLCGLALPSIRIGRLAKLRRLIHGMRRRVQELHRMRGGYTRH
jgi:hypothetical protein